MLAAFTLALGQLGDRRILAVLGKSLALTIAAFALAAVGVYFAIAQWTPTDGNGGFVAAALVGLVLIVSLWFAFRQRLEKLPDIETNHTIAIVGKSPPTMSP